MVYFLKSTLKKIKPKLGKHFKTWHDANIWSGKKLAIKKTTLLNKLPGKNLLKEKNATIKYLNKSAARFFKRCTRNLPHLKPQKHITVKN